MAATKKGVTQVIEIRPIELARVQLRLVGDTSLIMHQWSAKAKRQMLEAQQGKSGEELAGYVRRFCQRKWNSDFSREMSRSCTEMVRDWRER